MSKKRFEKGYDDKGNALYIYDNQTDKMYYLHLEGVINLLNSLAEENEQLKSTIIHLEEECGARENDYENLKKQFHKIPKNIREVWKE